MPRQARIPATPAAREAVIRLRAARGPQPRRDVMWRQTDTVNPVTR